MNKHEVEIAKIQAGAEKFSQVVGLFQMVVTGAIIVTSIWVIMGGLKGLCGASEGQLGAMAIIVEKLRLSEIVHYFLDGLLGIGFVVQRRIAKRAIKEKSRQQHRAESLDLHRSSSGLTPTGETPND